MQPRASLDIEILIVVVVNVLVILGLGWALLTNERSEPPRSPTPGPTVIESEVPPLETRAPSYPQPAPPTKEKPPTATATNLVSYPGPPDETPRSTSTLTGESQSASSTTPAAPEVQPLPIGKYDDTHPGIIYDRYWTSRMNSGTQYAYQGTLHISDGIGNELSFRFTGQQIILGYQRGKNFGIVTVLIDEKRYSFHEQAFDRLWRSPPVSPGTHSVRLIHESGESINLDYIEVLD